MEAIIASLGFIAVIIGIIGLFLPDLKLFLISVAFFLGLYLGNELTTKNFRTKAIVLGFAKYEVNEVAETKFVWLTNTVKQVEKISQ